MYHHYQSSFLALILSSALLATPVKAQPNMRTNANIVLREGVIGKEFIFGKWAKEKGSETRLKYLGQLTTNSGLKLKIINSIWFWGYSGRATSRILCYNESNKLMGSYTLNMIYELPSVLKQNKLIFGEVCAKERTNQLLAEVDLSKGLPNRLTINCGNTLVNSYDLAVNE